VVVNTAAALDPAGADGTPHLYVRDIDASTTTLADRDSGANGTVGGATEDGFDINADGSRLTWASRATIAGAPADHVDHVFLRDLRSGVTTLVSREDGAGGKSIADPSFQPVIDASGDHVAFTQSVNSRLGIERVLVRDVSAGHTETVSLASNGALFDDARDPSIDASGQRIGFNVRQRDGFAAYLRDRGAGTTEVVSRSDASDAPALSDDFATVAISPNGNCAAFSGTFTGLGDGFDSHDFEAVHTRALRSDCPARPLNPSGGGPADRNDGGRDDPPRHSGDGGTKVPPKPPVLSALRVSPNRFWVFGPIRSGTEIQYRLTRASKVTLLVDRLSTGHVKGHRCLAHQRRGKRCTIAKRIGSFRQNGRAGKNKFTFSGLIARKRLARGHYRLTAVPAGGRGDNARFAVITAPQVEGEG
jgi:hypothetical protein